MFGLHILRTNNKLERGEGGRKIKSKTTSKCSQSRTTNFTLLQMFPLFEPVLHFLMMQLESTENE